MADRIYIADKATLDAVKEDTTDLLGNFGAIKDIKGHKYKPVMSIGDTVVKSVRFSGTHSYYKELYIYTFDKYESGSIQKYDLELNLVAEARRLNGCIYGIFVDEKYIFVITRIARDGSNINTLMKLDKNTLEYIQDNDIIDTYINREFGPLLADDNFIYYIDHYGATICLYKFDIDTLQLSCREKYSLDSDYNIKGIAAQLDNDYIYVGGYMEDSEYGMHYIRRFNKNDLSFKDNSVSLCNNTSNFMLYKDYMFVFDDYYKKMYYIRKDNFTADKPVQLFNLMTGFGEFRYADEEYIYCGSNRIKISDTEDVEDWEVENFPVYVICVKNQYAFSQISDNAATSLQKHKLIYNISHYEEVME